MQHGNCGKWAVVGALDFCRRNPLMKADGSRRGHPSGKRSDGEWSQMAAQHNAKFRPIG